jgi:ElaB/YqjD/DUF883 family membrane-anchored ribosome-binding protein
MTTNIETTRKRLADRTTQLGKDVQEMRSAGKQLAADSVDVVRQTANELMEDGRSKAREVVASAQSKVQEKPVKSVLVAAAIGFLLGVFWRRR